MKLHIYQGDYVEVVPKDVSHVIVDDKVTDILKLKPSSIGAKKKEQETGQ